MTRVLHTSASARVRPRPATELGPGARRAVLAAAGGACFALLLYWAWGRSGPFVYQDEHVYGVLARSVGQGEGYAFQDLTVTAYKTLWPVVAAPAWALFDGEAAWRAAQVVNAALWSLTFPSAYALARRVAGFVPALVVALAATLTPAAFWAGQLMTEALAYPLAALALLAAVRLLERPTAWRTAAAFAAAAGAGTARTQMLVCLPVLLLAVALDVARQGAGWRARLRAHRWSAAVAAVLALAGLAVLAAGRGSDLVGTYSGTASGVDAAEVGRFLVRYASVMATAMALLPFVALIAITLRRASWREARIAPLLCVAVAAVAVFWANGAWASASLSPELRERYVFYPLPAVLALLPAVAGRVRPLALAAVAAVLALYLLPVLPELYGANESEVVQYDVGRVASRLGLGDGGPLADVNVWACVVAVLAALAAGTMALRRRVPAWATAAALVVPTLAVQVAVLAVREQDANTASGTFTAAYPEPGDFLDARVQGPAALVETPGTRPLARYHFSLGNAQLDRTWRVPGVDEHHGLGADCPLEAEPDGSLRPAPALVRRAPDPERPCSGAALARYLLFDDELRTVVVENGELLLADGPTRLYEIEPGVAPRIAYGPPPQP